MKTEIYNLGVKSKCDPPLFVDQRIVIKQGNNVVILDKEELELLEDKIGGKFKR